MGKAQEAERKFVLSEVPTQFGMVIKNTETDENLSQDEVLIEIMNMLSDIKKSVA